MSVFPIDNTIQQTLSPIQWLTDAERQVIETALTHRERGGALDEAVHAAQERYEAWQPAAARTPKQCVAAAVLHAYQSGATSWPEVGHCLESQPVNRPRLIAGVAYGHGDAKALADVARCFNITEDEARTQHTAALDAFYGALCERAAR